MDEELPGKCGFYCGACPTWLKGGCRGCEREHATGNCFTRDCVKKKQLNFCGACATLLCDAILKELRSTALDGDWLAWKKARRTDRKAPLYPIRTKRRFCRAYSSSARFVS